MNELPRIRHLLVQGGKHEAWNMKARIMIRRCLPVLLLVVGTVLVPLLHAQIHGTRASVTSVGGSHFFPPGPRASVTSLGPHGFGPNRVRRPNSSRFVNRRRDFRHSGVGFLPLYSPYYGEDAYMEQADGTVPDAQPQGQAESEQEYYDERLSQLQQEIDEMEHSRQGTQPAAEALQTQTPDQPDTILVFRDGHTIIVKNYAIVGDTLYDLSGSSGREIALAELDLSATQKQNDDRGVGFQPPATPVGD